MINKTVINKLKPKNWDTLQKNLEEIKNRLRKENRKSSKINKIELNIQEEKLVYDDTPKTKKKASRKEIKAQEEKLLAESIEKAGVDYSQIKKPKNEKLTNARKAKNDEFYTRLSDVENELRHYKEHFKDKVVLCNCDDPTYSSFWKYFHMSFSVLGLRKLIGTHFENKEPNSYAVIYSVKNSENGKNDSDTSIAETILLKGNGDFRSDECLEYLKECDIVVTNPPFSLFGEFISVMNSWSKSYVLLGSPNAVTYSSVFPLIRDNKLWLGNKPWSKEVYFIVGDEYKKSLLENKKEGSGYIVENGEVYARNPSVWFTNLTIKKRKEDLILTKNYSETDYPKYDNYDAINVDKVKDIPMNYDGVMGVPISFMDKYNPDQFEIVGWTIKGMCNVEFKDLGTSNPMICGKSKYKRIFIKRKISN